MKRGDCITNRMETCPCGMVTCCTYLVYNIILTCYILDAYLLCIPTCYINLHGLPTHATGLRILAGQTICTGPQTLWLSKTLGPPNPTSYPTSWYLHRRHQHIYRHVRQAPRFSLPQTYLCPTSPLPLQTPRARSFAAQSLANLEHPCHLNLRFAPRSLQFPTCPPPSPISQVRHPTTRRRTPTRVRGRVHPPPRQKRHLHSRERATHTWSVLVTQDAVRMVPPLTTRMQPPRWASA